MPTEAHYFFAVQAAGRWCDDEAGAWLPDDQSALAHAKTMIEELKDDSETDYSDWLMVVQDADRQTIVSIPF